MPRASSTTLCVPDVAHGTDALITESISGHTLLLNTINGGNLAFRSNHKVFLGDWLQFLVSQDQYHKKWPSSGNTRAWAGAIRVCAYMFTYFPQLTKFLSQKALIVDLASRTNKNVESEVEHHRGAALLAKNFTDHTQLLQFQIFIALRMTDCQMEHLLLFQLRRKPSVHRIWSFYAKQRELYMVPSVKGMRDDDKKFAEYLNQFDPLLLEFYKRMDDSDKTAAKKGMFDSIKAARLQLLKNWGDVSLVISDNDLCLQFVKLGDCWKEAQHSYFLLAAYLDPRQAKVFGVCLSKSVLNVGMIWARVDVPALYIDLKDYYASLQTAVLPSADNFDLQLFWNNARNGDFMYGIRIGAELQKLGPRVINKVSGAADVERGQSTMGLVSTKINTRMSDDTVLSRTMIRSGSTKRAELSNRRSAKKLVRFRTVRFALGRAATGIEFVRGLVVTARQKKQIAKFRESFANYAKDKVEGKDVPKRRRRAPKKN